MVDAPPAEGSQNETDGEPAGPAAGVVVVTGASRGLGRHVCERLAARGTPVFGLARDTRDLPFPASDCDVGDPDAVKAVARQLRRDRIAIAGLVNAAGIASMNLALTTPPATSQRIVTTNLLGTIYCCQSFAPLMLRERRGGAIVNFSTIAVALGLKGESVYAASKAGVEAFSRAFAREMADFDVTVNCIAPGPIETALLSGVTAAQVDAIVSRQVIPRRFTPDAVSDLVELLLDPRSRSLSGQVLHVGGA